MIPPNIITLRDGYYIIELPNGRNIHIQNGNIINMDTCAGSVIVHESDGKVTVCLYDHFDIEIKGGHKERPVVTIDSNEYPTTLVIRDSESSWIEVRDDRLLSKLQVMDGAYEKH